MREGEGEGEGRGRAGVPGPVISPKAVAAWKELFFASKGDKGGEGEGGVASKFVAQLNAREREALRKALSMDEQQDPVSPPTREKEQQQTSGLCTYVCVVCVVENQKAGLHLIMTLGSWEWIVVAMHTCHG